MQGHCSVCGIIVATGEKVRFQVEGVWRQVPSERVFAVQRNGFEYVPNTFRHASCEEDDE